MTIVVALKDEKTKKIYLACDSQATDTNSLDKTHRKDSKIFEKNGLHYGFTSSYRMGQILRFHSERVLLPPASGSPYEQVGVYYIPMWRRILKENGFTSISNNEETGGTFIVVYEGEIFCVQDDFQLEHSYENYVAIGCGMDYALGSLYETSRDSKLSAKVRVQRAVEAACYFSAGCGDDTQIIEIPFKGGDGK